MDDRTLLEAIRAIVKEETTPLAARLDKVDARLENIEGDIMALKADVATHNHETVPKLDLIAESVLGLVERADRLDAIEETVEKHGTQIWALEQAVKAK